MLNGVSMVVQGCFKGTFRVFRVFQVCFMVILRVLLGWLRDVLMVFEVYFKDGSREF